MEIENNNILPINKLPMHILIQIFSYVDIKERRHLTRVCKHWNTIIEIMWQNIKKLTVRTNGKKNYIIRCRGPNHANVACRCFSDLTKVLRNCNGGLTYINIVGEFSMLRNCNNHINDLENLCKEMRKCKQLKSLKIGDIPIPQYYGSFVKFLPSLPTAKLQNLYCANLGFVSKSIDALLMRTPDLKYLYINTLSSSILEVIEKKNTLESLHFSHYTPAAPQALPLSNISKLSNLRKLSILNSISVDDKLLQELGKNCILLEALELHCSKKVSQIGFDCIGTLEYLNYLNLKMESQSLNYETLCSLSNLETLYLNCDPAVSYYQEPVLLDFMQIAQHLPKLKKYFYLEAEKKNFIDNRQLKFCIPQNLAYGEWEELTN